uniref:Uncharacterized protein n=1 Tax=Micrurus spixii TaxID=129469 RepID=A0A2D4LL80_9SAUR
MQPKAEEERSGKKQPGGQVRHWGKSLCPFHPPLPRVVRNASDAILVFPRAMWAAQPCVPAQPGLIALWGVLCGGTFLRGPPKFSCGPPVVPGPLVGNYCFKTLHGIELDYLPACL